MIKGAQRRMVEIRTPDSKLFETAYFLLRPQPMPEADAHDMIAEADGGGIVADALRVGCGGLYSERVRGIGASLRMAFSCGRRTGNSRGSFAPASDPSVFRQCVHGGL